MQTGVTSVTINISGLSALHPDVVLIGHDRWLENSSQLPMTSQRFVSKGLTRTGWFPVGEFVLPVLVRLTYYGLQKGLSGEWGWFSG